MAIVTIHRCSLWCAVPHPIAPIGAYWSFHSMLLLLFLSMKPWQYFSVRCEAALTHSFDICRFSQMALVARRLNTAMSENKHCIIFPADSRPPRKVLPDQERSYLTPSQEGILRPVCRITTLHCIASCVTRQFQACARCGDYNLPHVAFLLHILISHEELEWRPLE